MFVSFIVLSCRLYVIFCNCGQMSVRKTYSVILFTDNVSTLNVHNELKFDLYIISLVNYSQTTPRRGCGHLGGGVATTDQCIWRPALCLVFSSLAVLSSTTHIKYVTYT